MKYFQLSVDENYIPPKPIGWYGKLDKKSWEQKKSYEMPKHSLFMVEQHMHIVFTDIVTFPCFMISERIKNILQKYDPSIRYARMIFYNQERKQSKAYYLPFLKEIEVQSQKGANPFELIYLEQEKLRDKVIMEIREQNQRGIIVRLDLLESILRRGAIGIGVKEVKVVERRGSEKEFEKFLERGQNTLYSLDWDFYTYKETEGQYVSQYAALVNDAEDKAIIMGQRGKGSNLNQNFVFSIPIYENIPTYNNEEYAPYPDPNHVNRDEDN